MHPAFLGLLVLLQVLVLPKSYHLNLVFIFFLLKINLDFHRTHNHERHNSFEFRAQNSAMKCQGSCPNWFICEAIEYTLYPHRASLNPRLHSGLSKLLGRGKQDGGWGWYLEWTTKRKSNACDTIRSKKPG